MKVIIDEQEWYPVSNFETEEEFASKDLTMYVKDPRIEVPPEDVERWRRVFAAFEAVQKELQAIDKAHWENEKSPAG